MLKIATSKLTDEELIDLAKQNHPQAVSTLIDRYKGMVYTLSFRILKNQLDAEEAAQDCFVKAFRSLGDFRLDCKFSTWLYRICFNNAISRSRINHHKTVDIDQVKHQHLESQNILDELSSVEKREYLNKAINMLDPEEATLITLYYTEENSVSEISEITGLSESNVKIKLFRSRTKLYGNLEVLLNNEVKTLYTN